MTSSLDPNTLEVNRFPIGNRCISLIKGDEHLRARIPSHAQAPCELILTSKRESRLDIKVVLGVRLT